MSMFRALRGVFSGLNQAIQPLAAIEAQRQAEDEKRAAEEGERQGAAEALSTESTEPREVPLDERSIIQKFFHLGDTVSQKREEARARSFNYLSGINAAQIRWQETKQRYLANRESITDMQSLDQFIASEISQSFNGVSDGDFLKGATNYLLRESDGLIKEHAEVLGQQLMAQGQTAIHGDLTSRVNTGDFNTGEAWGTVLQIRKQMREAGASPEQFNRTLFQAVKDAARDSGTLKPFELFDKPGSNGIALRNHPDYSEKIRDAERELLREWKVSGSVDIRDREYYFNLNLERASKNGTLTPEDIDTLLKRPKIEGRPHLTPSMARTLQKNIDEFRERQQTVDDVAEKINRGDAFAVGSDAYKTFMETWREGAQKTGMDPEEMFVRETVMNLQSGQFTPEYRRQVDILLNQSRNFESFSRAVEVLEPLRRDDVSMFNEVTTDAQRDRMSVYKVLRDLGSDPTQITSFLQTAPEDLQAARSTIARTATKGRDNYLNEVLTEALDVELTNDQSKGWFGTRLAGNYPRVRETALEIASTIYALGVVNDPRTAIDLAVKEVSTRFVRFDNNVFMDPKGFPKEWNDKRVRDHIMRGRNSEGYMGPVAALLNNLGYDPDLVDTWFDSNQVTLIPVEGDPNQVSLVLSSGLLLNVNMNLKQMVDTAVRQLNIENENLRDLGEAASEAARDQQKRQENLQFSDPDAFTGS